MRLNMIDIQKPNKDYNLKRSLIAFGLFVCFAFFIAISFRLAVVRGESMEPTLHNGSIVVITRAYWLFGPPRENDVVVLNHDDGLLIKRIRRFESSISGPPRIFVQGDNMRVSWDSRDFGFISSDEIVGKVLMYSGNPPVSAIPVSPQNSPEGFGGVALAQTSSWPN